MAVINKPSLPPGAHRDLVEALHELHHRAGRPSLRDLGRAVGVSRTTVAAVFSTPRTPSWGTLELLVEELGGDTTTFHRLWLAATRVSSSPGTATAARSGRVPHQLPFAAPQLLGRDTALATLAGLADGSIVVVTGMAGVGKSALAIHAARRRGMPDGELYIDLRGHDALDPVDPSVALEQLLVSAEVEDRIIPGSGEARAALWRTITADRRYLLLLDNARSVEQVRALLPGPGGTLVIITSRDDLPGLVARHGATRIDLERLTRNVSVELLDRLIESQPRPDNQTLHALAVRCADLPLALRLAAERANSRAPRPLTELLVELDAQTDRLDVLDSGDDSGVAVRAVFSWSAAQLTPQQRRAFRLAGLAPAQGLDPAAAAALFDLPLGDSRRLLDSLARLHLLERTADGVRMHDLLRAYALELLDDEAAGHRHLAQLRLIDHVIDRASRTVAGADPAAPSATTSTPLAGPTPHRLWLDEHRSLLRAIADLAADQAPDRAIRLASLVARYLDTRGYYADGIVIHSAALRAAVVSGNREAEAWSLHELAAMHRRLGEYGASEDLDTRSIALFRSVDDARGEATSLLSLAIVQWRTGRYELSHDHLDKVLALSTDIADDSLQGAALYNLGIVNRRLGHYSAAAQFHARALDLQRSIGDRVGEGRALANAGVVELRLGNLATAREYEEAALDIHRDLGDRTGECVALINLGLILERQGDLVASETHLLRALELSQETGYRIGEADAVRGLGVIAGSSGRTDEAIERLQQGIAIGDQVGESDIGIGARNELATVMLATADKTAARYLFEEALDRARAAGDLYEQARAWDGIAQTSKDRSEARTALLNAVDLFAHLGLPEHTAAQSRLSAMSDP